MRISDWSSDVCSSDLMGAAVVLTAPDDSRTLVREADTFAARLVHAGEEAILTVRVVQVTVDAHGYAFARQSFGQWQALDEGPFEPVEWTEGTTPMLDGRQVQASFRFEPPGGSVKQRVRLAHHGRQAEGDVDASRAVQGHAPRGTP